MKEVLEKIIAGGTLTQVEAQGLLDRIFKNEINAAQIAGVLCLLRTRPLTIAELNGFRLSMLEHCVKVDLREFSPIDLCGTGGDGKNTFNISTISAFVVAAAGVKVAKHGNYSVSSSCGSSNLLEELGIKFTTDKDILRNQIEKFGICFLHAPLFHPSMKAVAPIRKELGVKTFFNLLGPLVNPAMTDTQVIGVYSPELVKLYSDLSRHAGKNFSIVHGNGGYDEISLTDSFVVSDNNEEKTYTPEQLGLMRLSAEQLEAGDSVKENAQIAISILKGEGTEAQMQVVIANSGFSIYAASNRAGKEFSLQDSLALAREILSSKKAYILLESITA